MLVLSRKKTEEIAIGSDVRVVVLAIRGDKVRLGVLAPRDLPVHRHEVAKAIARDRGPDALSDPRLATLRRLVDRLGQISAGVLAAAPDLDEKGRDALFDLAEIEREIELLGP